jgi:fucose 4-O-acetylase-like acetyltransferase
MKEFRLFLLSPVPAAMLGAIISQATGGFPRPVSVAVFYLLLLYGAQLLFGVAIRAYLQKANRRSALSFAIGGTAMTGIPATPYLLWATAQNPGSSSNMAFVLVLWLLFGALTGLVYWRLARPGPKNTATL